MRGVDDVARGARTGWGGANRSLALGGGWPDSAGWGTGSARLFGVVRVSAPHQDRADKVAHVVQSSPPSGRRHPRRPGGVAGILHAQQVGAGLEKRRRSAIRPPCAWFTAAPFGLLPALPS
jgi:hypothetical protein